MLTIREPLALRTASSVLILSPAFGEKIEANYDTGVNAAGGEELLHLMGEPPQIYIQEGGRYQIANSLTDNRRQVTVHTVNQVLNRLLLWNEIAVTYQDQVYIERQLRRMGIREVSAFLRQVREACRDCREIKQLTESYESFGRIFRDGSVSLRELRNKKRGADDGGEREFLSFSLNRDIYRRLDTKQIYEEVCCFNRNPVMQSQVMQYHIMQQNQTQILQHGVTQNQITGNRTAAFTDETLRLSQYEHARLLLAFAEAGEAAPGGGREIPERVNPYELVNESTVSGTVTMEEMESRIVSAVLYNLAEQAFTHRLETASDIRREWLDYQSAYRETAVQTWSRFEDYYRENRRLAEHEKDFYEETRRRRRKELAILHEFEHLIIVGKHGENRSGNFSEILHKSMELVLDRGEAQQLLKAGEEMTASENQKEDRTAKEALGLAFLQQQGSAREHESSSVITERELRKGDYQPLESIRDRAGGNHLAHTYSLTESGSRILPKEPALPDDKISSPEMELAKTGADAPGVSSQETLQPDCSYREVKKYLDKIREQNKPAQQGMRNNRLWKTLEPVKFAVELPKTHRIINNPFLKYVAMVQLGKNAEPLSNTAKQDLYHKVTGSLLLKNKEQQKTTIKQDLYHKAAESWLLKNAGQRRGAVKQDLYHKTGESLLIKNAEELKRTVKQEQSHKTTESRLLKHAEQLRRTLEQDLAHVVRKSHLLKNTESLKSIAEQNLTYKVPEHQLFKNMKLLKSTMEQDLALEIKESRLPKITKNQMLKHAEPTINTMELELARDTAETGSIFTGEVPVAHVNYKEVKKYLDKINEQNVLKYRELAEHQLWKNAEPVRKIPDMKRIREDSRQALINPSALLEHIKKSQIIPQTTAGKKKDREETGRETVRETGQETVRETGQETNQRIRQATGQATRQATGQKTEARQNLEIILRHADDTTRYIYEQIWKYSEDGPAGHNSPYARPATPIQLVTDINNIIEEKQSRLFLADREDRQGIKMSVHPAGPPINSTGPITTTIQHFNTAQHTHQETDELSPVSSASIIYKHPSALLTEELLEHLSKRQELHVREEIKTMAGQSATKQQNEAFRQTEITKPPSARELQDLIEKGIIRQMGTISEKVYHRLEKKMEYEMARRGR